MLRISCGTFGIITYNAWLLGEKNIGGRWEWEFSTGQTAGFKSDDAGIRDKGVGMS